MDDQVLSKLSADQLAALNADQKAIFCLLSEADQKFFSQTFKPSDLPVALDRKGEILKRNQANREFMERYQAAAQAGAQNLPAGEPGEPGAAPQSTPKSSSSGEDILMAVAGAVGLGAAAAAVATDNRASWQGVKPADLVVPLHNEFDNDRTRIDVAGSPQALTVTLLILAGSHTVPALTIGLSQENDSTTVKMSELTSHGVLETVKEGGLMILGMAADGLRILTRSQIGGVSPGDLVNTASHTLAEGADLAEVAGNLKLKDRAWKVIQQTAETLEAAYLSQLEQERQARYALEKAWDNFYNCPTCGVTFGAEDPTCRVCGSARPESPHNPDPRKQ